MSNILQTLLTTYQQNPAAVYPLLPDFFQAVEDGRIVELPCKVGDTVYFDDVKHYQAPEDSDPRIREVKADDITIAKPYWKLNGGDEEFLPEDFGKTVFYSRKAAEQALKERET